MLKRNSSIILHLIFGLTLLGGVLGGSALAAKSTFAASGAKIDLVEETDSVDSEGNPLPFQNIDGAMPGESYSKIPKVNNLEDSVNSNIRIRVEISAVDSEGNPISFDPSLLEIDYNLEDWEVCGENLFCYKKELAPGESTTPLFTHVAFSPLLGNPYQDAIFSVKLFAEAIQVFSSVPSVDTPDTGVVTKSLDRAIEFSLLSFLALLSVLLTIRFIYRRRNS